MKPLTPQPHTNSPTQSRRSRGRRVAQLLAGAWQQAAPSAPISAEEIAELAPLLLSMGAAGLAWRRIRETNLSRSPASAQLQQAYRFHSLEASVHAHRLKQVIARLRSFGVEPVLVKGWAIARLYPELGLRPFSDLDLCVLPDQYRAAQAALANPESRACNVDLHQGFGKFCDRQAEDIFARSQLVLLDDVEVRVLREEDHLHFLCLHLLRHGAVRPLWLCDIAVLLEQRAPGFDWARCLSGSRRAADWVACAIGLAHQLVGAEVEGTPVADRTRRLPGWLVPTVLREWGTPYRSPGQVEVYLRHPLRLWRGLPKELPHHWPNAIEATMTLKGPFNEMPRLPFQVGHVLSRSASLLRQLVGSGGGPALSRN
ncbi:MAG: nucleotidyltransferase family protein [Blastocatellia bacterium]